MSLLDNTNLLQALIEQANNLADAGGGGGIDIKLPTGYAMEYGVYIPAEDATGSIFITLENTYKWREPNRTGNTYAFTCGMDFNSTNMSGTLVGYGVTSAGGANLGRKTDVSSSGTLMGSNTAPAHFSTNDKSNTLVIAGNETFPLKAGVSYFWIVIGEVA